MKIRYFLVLTTTLFTFGCQSPTLNQPTDQEILQSRDLVIDDQEIVVIAKSSSSAHDFVRKAQQRGYQLRSKELLSGMEFVLITLKTRNGQSGGSAIRELEALEPGITAGVNHAYGTRETSRVSGMRTYAKELMKWNATDCGAKTKIGILDTSIGDYKAGGLTIADFSRSDQKSEVSKHAIAVINVFEQVNFLQEVDLYHADIVFESETMGTVASVDSMMRGLNWMLQHDVSLVNISLSGPYNKILDMGFQRAEQKGLIVVAAAGNDGPEQTVRYPAAFESTLAVTAVDADTNIYRMATRGLSLDFSAPGVDIALNTGGDAQYLTGTSIAAPFVTARIAADEKLADIKNVEKVRKRLAESALDLGEVGHDSVYGYGLVLAPEDCQF